MLKIPFNKRHEGKPIYRSYVGRCRHVNEKRSEFCRLKWNEEFLPQVSNK